MSGDNPTENLKECDFVSNVINDTKFGFTCDNVNGQLGFINLPHIPKSQDYATFDNREIKILQANRYNDYLASLDRNSLHGIFQDSTCGSNTTNQANEQVAFAGSFDDDECLTLNEKEQDENGDVWDIKR